MTTISSDFFAARGTFYQFTVDDSQSPGTYAVEGLSQNFSAIISSDPNAAAASLLFQSQAIQTPLLITNITIGQSDIVSQIPCLNNVKVFYSFGQNFGQVQITGELFLGALGADDIAITGYKRLTDFFDQNRVSKGSVPIKISIARKGYFMYLVGMSIMRIVEDMHVLPFALFGTLLDLSGSAAGLINPANVVLTEANASSGSLVQAFSSAPSANQIVPTAAGNSTTTPPSGSSVAGAATPAAATLTSLASGTPLTSDQAQLLQKTMAASSTIAPSSPYTSNIQLSENASPQSQSDQAAAIAAASVVSNPSVSPGSVVQNPSYVPPSYVSSVTSNPPKPSR